MRDYITKYEFWRDDCYISSDTIITIEEDIIIEDSFERDETIRDILLEKLKEEFDDDVKLLDYEELTDRDYDIYKLTY